MLKIHCYHKELIVLYMIFILELKAIMVVTLTSWDVLCCLKFSSFAHCFTRLVRRPASSFFLYIWSLCDNSAKILLDVVLLFPCSSGRMQHVKPSLSAQCFCDRFTFGSTWLACRWFGSICLTLTGSLCAIVGLGIRHVFV